MTVVDIGDVCVGVVTPNSPVAAVGLCLSLFILLFFNMRKQAVKPIQHYSAAIHAASPCFGG